MSQALKHIRLSARADYIRTNINATHTTLLTTPATHFIRNPHTISTCEHYPQQEINSLYFNKKLARTVSTEVLSILVFHLVVFQKYAAMLLANI